MSTSPTSDASDANKTPREEPTHDDRGYEYDDSAAEPDDLPGFRYLKTPKDSPYVITSPTDPSKTRLSLEGFRIWCALGQNEATGEVLSLTDQQENDASYDPVLTGSNRAQEWGDGQAYFFVTMRRILQKELAPKAMAESIMDVLEDYQHSDMPLEFPTFREAQDSGFTTEYFVFADEDVRELVFTTFRDNYDELFAEAEKVLTEAPKETA